MNPELEFCIEEILGQAAKHCERGELEAIPYLIGEAQLEAANYGVSDISKDVKKAYENMLPTLIQGFDEACLNLDRRQFERYKAILNDYRKFTQADIADKVIERLEGILTYAKTLAKEKRYDEIKPIIGFAESCAELIPELDISRRVKRLYDKCNLA